MFKVGDRVRSTVDYPDNNENIVRGDTGTVVHCEDDIVFVEWDDFGYGNVEFGYGWNVHFDEIEAEVDDVQYEFDEEKFKELIGF